MMKGTCRTSLRTTQFQILLAFLLLLTTSVVRSATFDAPPEPTEEDKIISREQVQDVVTQRPLQVRRLPNPTGHQVTGHRDKKEAAIEEKVPPQVSFRSQIKKDNHRQEPIEKDLPLETAGYVLPTDKPILQGRPRVLQNGGRRRRIWRQGSGRRRLARRRYRAKVSPTLKTATATASPVDIGTTSASLLSKGRKTSTVQSVTIIKTSSSEFTATADSSRVTSNASSPPLITRATPRKTSEHIASTSRPYNAKDNITSKPSLITPGTPSYTSTSAVKSVVLSTPSPFKAVVFSTPSSLKKTKQTLPISDIRRATPSTLKPYTKVKISTPSTKEVATTSPETQSSRKYSRQTSNYRLSSTVRPLDSSVRPVKISVTDIPLVSRVPQRTPQKPNLDTSPFRRIPKSRKAPGSSLSLSGRSSSPSSKETSSGSGSFESFSVFIQPKSHESFPKSHPGNASRRKTLRLRLPGGTSRRNPSFASPVSEIPPSAISVDRKFGDKFGFGGKPSDVTLSTANDNDSSEEEILLFDHGGHSFPSSPSRGIRRGNINPVVLGERSRKVASSVSGGRIPIGTPIISLEKSVGKTPSVITHEKFRGRNSPLITSDQVSGKTLPVIPFEKLPGKKLTGVSGDGRLSSGTVPLPSREKVISRTSSFISSRKPPTSTAGNSNEKLSARTPVTPNQKFPTRIPNIPSKKFPARTPVTSNEKFLTRTPVIPNVKAPIRTPVISNEKFPTRTPVILNEKFPTRTPVISNVKLPTRTPAIPNEKFPPRTPAIPSKNFPTRTPAIPNEKFPTRTPAIPNEKFSPRTPAIPSKNFPTRTPAIPNEKFHVRTTVNPTVKLSGKTPSDTLHDNLPIGIPAVIPRKIPSRTPHEENLPGIAPVFPGEKSIARHPPVPPPGQLHGKAPPASSGNIPIRTHPIITNEKLPIQASSVIASPKGKSSSYAPPSTPLPKPSAQTSAIPIIRKLVSPTPPVPKVDIKVLSQVPSSGSLGHSASGKTPSTIAGPTKLPGKPRTALPKHIKSVIPAQPVLPRGDKVSSPDTPSLTKALLKEPIEIPSSSESPLTPLVSPVRNRPFPAPLPLPPIPDDIPVKLGPFNIISSATSSHSRPLTLPTPLVTPFNPYTTIFLPNFGQSFAGSSSYRGPLQNSYLNLPLSGTGSFSFL